MKQNIILIFIISVYFREDFKSLYMEQEAKFHVQLLLRREKVEIYLLSILFLIFLIYDKIKLKYGKTIRNN